MSERPTKVSEVCVALAVLACACALHAAAPSPVRADRAAQKDKEKELRQLLDREIEYGGVDERATLREILNMLQKSQGIAIDIDEAAFEVDGLKNAASEKDGPEVASAEKPLPPGKMAFRTLLAKVLARVPAVGARFVIRRGGRLEVTTENALRRELRLPTTAEEREDGLLPVPIVWEVFDGSESLADALKVVSESMDVSVLIDPAVKDKASVKIDAALRNVPLDTAVELLADMGGLAVVKKPGAYYVTTAEHAERLAKKK